MSTCSPLNDGGQTKIKSKQESHNISLQNFNLNNANPACSLKDDVINICQSKSNNSSCIGSWKSGLTFEGNNLIQQKSKNDTLWKTEKLLPNFMNEPIKFGNNNDEKNRESKKLNFSNANNSTLSLHIAAYENANLHVESSQNSVNDGSTKQNNIRKTWKDIKQQYFSNNLTVVKEGGIEIPRGNENEPNTPEIMQFKASQKLLDPNQVTQVSMQQNHHQATATKHIDGLGANPGKKLDTPSAPVKPLKRRSIVSLVDVSKCPKINIDDYIQNLMTCVDKNGHVKDYLTDVNVIEQICVLAIENLSKMPSLLDLDPGINIVGDIHGQYTDLLRIFELCGPPDRTRYLFLGDYVDRGPQSLEVICLLLLLRVRYPYNIFLLRGNHECLNINRVYGFLHECEDRFQKIPVDSTIWGVQEIDLKGTQVWYRLNDVFNWLPMTALIGNKILCMHGGLSPQLESLDQLRQLVRPIDPETVGIHIDLLWSDPDPCLPNGVDDPDWGASARGISSHFNVKAVNNACNKLGLDMIVRGHQVVQDGYEFFANRKLVTIFSAPNYCGEYNNSGAIMTIDYNLQTAFHIIKPLAGAKKKSKATEVDFDDIDLDSFIAEGSSEKC